MVDRIRRRTAGYHGPGTGFGVRIWILKHLHFISTGWFYGLDVSLADCLAYFFSADELKGDNMYSCEKCKKWNQVFAGDGAS